MSSASPLPRGPLPPVTYRDPEALATVQELRLALHATNAQLQRVEAETHALLQALEGVGHSLAPVLLAHARADGAAVFVALQALSRRHFALVRDACDGSLH